MKHATDEWMFDDEPPATGPRRRAGAWSLDAVKPHIREQRGRHFDPQLTDLFVDNVQDFVAIREAYQG